MRHLDVQHDGLVPLVPLSLVATLGQLGRHDDLVDVVIMLSK